MNGSFGAAEGRMHRPVFRRSRWNYGSIPRVRDESVPAADALADARRAEGFAPERGRDAAAGGCR